MYSTQYVFHMEECNTKWNQYKYQLHGLCVQINVYKYEIKKNIKTFNKINRLTHRFVLSFRVNVKCDTLSYVYRF